MATVLELLKQSAARRPEAWQLKWSDIDFKTKTIHITTRKGGNPRIVRINDKLIAMLNRLPRKSQRAFTYKNSTYMSKTFRKQRKRAVQKLGNPRIKRIHFHTLRHWRATMEYHRTKDILHVMQFLGHKRIENTLRYIQLEQMLYKESDDYICKVANNVKEAKDLIETGFDHICEYQDKKLFKKPK